MEKMEDQHSSAAAFVEGGTQDASEDSCSICLELFCNSDPSTVTSCNHDFHLQCILEWCQRSSQCPMCWRPICLKDPTSQVLLEVVEKERIMRGNRSRGPVYVNPSLAGLEYEQLEASSEPAELDEHLMHLEREILSNRNRSTDITSLQAPELPQNTFATSGSGIITREVTQQVAVPQTNPSDPHPVQNSLSLGAGASGNNPRGTSNRNSSGNPTSGSNETSGPSDLQSFSESLKSRLNAASGRYRESIKKNTRGWKERLFSRNGTLSDLGSEVKKEVSNGIASVSRMMQRLEAKDNNNVNEVRRNKNNVDGSSSTNINPSMRLHIARVAASDGSSSSHLLSNANSSNAFVASPSSK